VRYVNIVLFCKVVYSLVLFPGQPSDGRPLFIRLDSYIGKSGRIIGIVSGVVVEILEDIIARYAGQPNMVLVALQDIQACIGYIPPAAIDQIAKALQVPAGEVQGVISFYSELRITPPGIRRVCVCHGDSCAAMGSHRIAQSVEAHLGTPPGTVTADGQFTYDVVYCLGNCALSPSIAIDDEVYGRCTPERVENLLSEVAGA
jgi:formate dehydrogenase subunit gamma